MNFLQPDPESGSGCAGVIRIPGPNGLVRNLPEWGLADGLAGLSITFRYFSITFWNF